MKNINTTPRYVNIIAISHMLIMLLISFLIYSTQHNPKYVECYQLLDRLLIDNIGIYSKSRPFISKALTNYVAFMGPITAIYLYYKGFDNINGVSYRWARIVLSITVFAITCYVNYFTQIYLNTENSRNRLIRNDEFIGYFMFECGMLFFFYGTATVLLRVLLNPKSPVITLTEQEIEEQKKHKKLENYLTFLLIVIMIFVSYIL